MPAVNFFEEDIAYKLKAKKEVRQWLKETINAEGYKLKELNYIFCSDAYLLQINKQYLDHDTYTDIITFDNSDIKDSLTGDIFISIERIFENAEKYQSGVENELHRVMVHGALHLVGYGDKTADDQATMTGKENEYLGKRNFTQHR